MNVASGAGLSEIPSKVIKHACIQFVPILTTLFNHCIDIGKFPIEWKSAIVTPLYKSKGVKTDLNNYRGISVLPPIAKIFEKILAMQITIYLKLNNILFSGQHGFRNGHSCETALHELISKINLNRDKRLINLLLFIDFRKAFDLVDSRLLLRKLFHYGFDTSALNLIANYFTDRFQTVKFNNKKSNLMSINLGVPQGSVLGPLFFLLFINDLAFILELYCKMFADDTTLLDADSQLDILISRFKKRLEPLIDWCKFNKLDLNWSKTFFMFITNKRAKLPSEIEVDGNLIKTVDNFKLLGVTLDNKLNFSTHCSNLKKIINRKMYSIKRLFYLATSVKIQFFKTFILPYFDYCLSLIIYFPKSTFQSLNTFFNCCLYRLFKFRPEISSIDKNDEDKLMDDFINRLNDYNLFTFQSRIANKLLQFVHGIKVNCNAPIELKQTLDSLTPILDQETPSKNTYELRGRVVVKNDLTETRYGHLTFSYFFSRFLPAFDNVDFLMKPEAFAKQLHLNHKKILKLFLLKFSNFNVFYNFSNFKKNNN